jgi:hypothetical protein
MRHGDELEILPEGIRIYQKTVEPLGIVDGSRCWARWVRGQRKDSEGKVSHLAISPIHPAYWTSVFHLEMRLDDHSGSLDRATGLLSELGVNMLFSDGALSGYRQAAFTAVCELQRVRQRALKILKTEEFHESPLFDEADSVAFERSRERQFQEIGLSLLVNLAELQARIRVRENAMFEHWKAHKTEPRHFLHSRAVETGPQPWYLPESVVEAVAGFISAGQEVPVGDPRTEEESQALAQTFRALQQVLSTREHSRSDGAPLLTQEALDVRRHAADLDEFTRYYLHTQWRNHWVEPVSLRGLLTLAYQRVWSDGPEIVFNYDASQNLLRFKDADSKRAFKDISGVEPTPRHPALGIASIHKHDRFIRLRVLDRAREARLITTTVGYETPFGNEKRVVLESLTKGLLHEVAGELAGKRVDLLRVTSQAFVYDAHIESGSIKMVGILPEPAQTDPATEVQRLNESLKESLERFRRTIPSPGCKLNAKVTLYQRRQRKLFLSIPHLARRLKDIVDEVGRVAEQEGFVVVRVHLQTGEVTNEVVAAVEECDAMLQVYVLRDAAPGGKLTRGDAFSFKWLLYEHGLARMRRIPILRLLEQGLPEASREMTQLSDREHPEQTFSLNEPLSESLGPAVATFLHTVVNSVP